MAAEPLPDQIAHIITLLADMGDAVATALSHATSALLDDRVRLAEQVIARDAAVDATRDRVEEVAAEALLIHGPVATDLRTVVAAIRAADDLERMGDLARHVAQVVTLRAPQPALPEQVRPDFAAMGEIAVRLGRKSAQVSRTRNVLLAAELESDDDAMDVAHQHMFDVLMDPSWPHGVGRAVDVTLLARYYERFADHAVAVADGVVYAVTGDSTVDVTT